MSKQLLHTYQSHVVVVALNDRAFAVIKDESSTSSSGAAVVLELMVAKKCTNDDAAKSNGGDDEKDEQSKKKQEKKKKKELNNGGNHQDTSNPHEIQAVCSTEIDSHVWLAVSREDKTLSLYSIPSSLARKDDQKGEETKSIYPTATYNVPKRARCLTFCSIPSSSASGNTCYTIIAGDLFGDANAFDVPTNDATANDKPTTSSTTRRLLLGHTASMITGLNVVPTTWDDDKPQQKQLILTADRDEKIRVSYFPETHIIHGYMLGHSSFISTMDAMVATVAASASGSDGGESSNQRSRALCITGSGDGTVRLWDYQKCKEVGMVPVVIKKTEDEPEDDAKMPAKTEDEVMEDDKQEEEGDEEDFDDEDFTDDEQGFDEHTIAVPLSVALSPKAENVIVARDGIASIDIHPIPPPPSKSTSSSMSLLLSQLVSLHKKQTVECPSQPLAVRCLSDGSVLVLAREPEYLLHYQCSGSQEATDTAEFKNASSTSPFTAALQEAVKSQKIIMPTTTLDKKGQEGEFTLQKNKVSEPGDYPKNNQQSDGEGGEDGSNVNPHLHWNDVGRKDMAKKAESRRRKRRREDVIKEQKKKVEVTGTSGDN